MLHLPALFINLIQQSGITSFLCQFDGCLEGDEITHLAHVYAIAIGIADLRCGGYDDDLLWFKAIKDGDDAALQCGTPNDGIVNEYDGIHMAFHLSVGHVIHVAHHVASVIVVGNEGAQFHILDGEFLHPGAHAQDAFHGCCIRLVFQLQQFLFLDLLQVVFQSFHHTVKRYFCRIGNE